VNLGLFTHNYYRVKLPFHPTSTKPRLRSESLGFSKQTTRWCRKRRKLKPRQFHVSRLTIL